MRDEVESTVGRRVASSGESTARHEKDKRVRKRGGLGRGRRELNSLSVRNETNSILGSESAVLLGGFQAEKIEVLGRVGDSANENEGSAKDRGLRLGAKGTYR